MTKFSVILPAGGSGTRFGGDKLSADLVGVPVIARSVLLFATRDDVEEIIIATNRREELEPLITAFAPAVVPRLRWAAGGVCRAETVRHGANAARCEWLAVHDAARPLTPESCIDRVLDAARASGAAAAALPVKPTIKQAAGPLPAAVIRTLPRQDLFELQTPQAMSRAVLLNAYDACKLPLEQITDDTQLLEEIGVAVTLVKGDEHNLKITTPLDLQIAATIIRSAH